MMNRPARLFVGREASRPPPDWSCVPEVMLAYKRVIDEGYATTMADGLAIESRASREHARSLTPEALAARRAGVEQRGREQVGGSEQ
jgi:hypothetical protein